MRIPARIVRTLPLAVAVCLFGGAAAYATVIEWAIDLDGFWHVPENWQSDPLLPGPDDDAVIDRPGVELTVTHSQGNTVIQSLTSDEALVFSGGSFRVTSGVSTVNADLTVGQGAWLTADGANFLANGSTFIDEGQFSARAGGRLDLSQATGYTLDDTLSGRKISASGTGSVMDLSGLLIKTGSDSSATLFAEADGGGLVDLSSLAQVGGGPTQFKALGDASVIDLSSLLQFDHPGLGGPSQLLAAAGGTIHLHEQGTSTVSDVQVFVGAGSSITGGLLALIDGSVLSGLGTISADVANDATVTPGVSPGTLTVLGDYEQASEADLIIEIGDGAHDLLQISGQATLAGRLIVQLFGGFEPSLGDSFVILTACSVEGAFDPVDWPSLSEGLSWALTTGPNAVTLDVIPEPAALALLVMGGIGFIPCRRKK